MLFESIAHITVFIRNDWEKNTKKKVKWSKVLNSLH